MIERFHAFATHEFELAARQSDGATLKEHLVAVWERSGRKPAKLADAPVCPAPGLWRDFLDLHNCRSYGQGGPSPITFLELDAWQRVKGVSLEPWELDCIRVADGAFLTSVSKRD